MKIARLAISALIPTLLLETVGVVPARQRLGRVESGRFLCDL
jgi:hypothetical protein